MIVEGYAVVYDSPATHDYTEIKEKNAFVSEKRLALYQVTK